MPYGIDPPSLRSYGATCYKRIKKYLAFVSSLPFVALAKEG